MLLWYFRAPRAARTRTSTPDASSTATSRSSCCSASCSVRLTGVAIWFTTIQVGARTIGLMVDVEFHWLWATEWVCFSVEVAAGYAFVKVGKRLDGPRSSPAARALRDLGVAEPVLHQRHPVVAADAGRGSARRRVAGLLQRELLAVAALSNVRGAMALAALSACIVINTLELERPRRAALVRRAARFGAPMVAMPVLAVWFVAVLPEDSREWLLGGSVAMMMFVGITAGAALLIGAYAVVALVVKRLYINGATATLLMALAFGATAAGEFVREGARKPYTIRNVLYSTSIYACRGRRATSQRRHGRRSVSAARRRALCQRSSQASRREGRTRAVRRVPHGPRRQCARRAHTRVVRTIRCGSTSRSSSTRRASCRRSRATPTTSRHSFNICAGRPQ